MEADEGAEARHLVASFSLGQAKLFYFLRSVSDMDAQAGSLEDRRRSAWDSVRHRRGLEGPPDTLPEMQALASRLLGVTNWDRVQRTWFDQAEWTIPERDRPILDGLSELPHDRRVSGSRSRWQAPLRTSGRFARHHAGAGIATSSCAGLADGLRRERDIRKDLGNMRIVMPVLVPGPTHAGIQIFAISPDLLEARCIDPPHIAIIRR